MPKESAVDKGERDEEDHLEVSHVDKGYSLEQHFREGDKNIKHWEKVKG